MKVIVNEKDKILEIWLTKSEKNNMALRESLEPFYKEWRAKRYLPVVYESGESDLQESILGLLRHNREIVAKRELEYEKKAVKKQSEFSR